METNENPHCRPQGGTGGGLGTQHRREVGEFVGFLLFNLLAAYGPSILWMVVARDFHYTVVFLPVASALLLFGVENVALTWIALAVFLVLLAVGSSFLRRSCTAWVFIPFLLVLLNSLQLLMIASYYSRRQRLNNDLGSCAEPRMHLKPDTRSLDAAALEDLRRRVVAAVVEQRLSKSEAARVFGVSRTSVHHGLDLYIIVAEKRPCDPSGRDIRSSPAVCKAGRRRRCGACSTHRTPDELGLPLALGTREAVGELIARRFGSG